MVYLRYMKDILSRGPGYMQEQAEEITARRIIEPSVSVRVQGPIETIKAASDIANPFHLPGHIYNMLFGSREMAAGTAAGFVAADVKTERGAEIYEPIMRSGPVIFPDAKPILGGGEWIPEKPTEDIDTFQEKVVETIEEQKAKDEDDREFWEGGHILDDPLPELPGLPEFKWPDIDLGQIGKYALLAGAGLIAILILTRRK